MKAAFAILASGCLVAGCGDTGTPAATEATATGEPLAALPLQHGFYVATDTPCEEASNATLSLVHARGINSARTACEFTLIERTGASTYRAVESCTEIPGGPIDPRTMLYEIPDSRQLYTRALDSDFRSHSRYCEQSSLPEPWRDNDISDLIGDSER